MRGDVLRDAPAYGRERVIVRRRMMNEGSRHGAAAGYTRIERGHHVPGSWMHPRFHIQDYGRYGFYQPMYGGRWIRYYDDALLIDPHGQVIDGEWGMNWNDYGPDWRHDESGIPEYAGVGDHHAVDEGYGDEGYEYGQDGCGYHSPQAGAIVITETVTTTPPTVEEKVWYEDVPVRHAPRHYKRKGRK